MSQVGTEKQYGTPVEGVSVVVPTYNESGNVAELVRRLAAVLDADLGEILIVDDSTDDTAQVAAESADRVPHRVRVVRREEPAGGLSGAVLTGMALAVHPWIVVMDGDLQHPPEDLPRLLAAGEARGADIVAASRYLDGGSAGGLDGLLRRLVSSGSTLVARALFPRRLRDCSDPMTGFFAVRRDALDLASLRPQGFKILLEVLLRHRLTLTEIPFAFGIRTAGASKATVANGAAFLRQLVVLRFQPSSPRLAQAAAEVV
ncbi:polyprenol monophosphomannose synthase [Leifsonia shinshuensis]|uniref:polyprenol monophosphomannose synthase n=1 Tax=Leifsonia shinshuensis TaxID=150026 RepID=UPI0016287D42|nr:polyprenol monophosphomannose synthase [Leifsonia shinshuensis]